MAELAIAVLGEEVVRFELEPGGFERLAAETLGIQGGDGDGFDAAFNEAARAVGDARRELLFLDSDLDVATAAVPEGQELDRELTVVLADLGDGVADGDATLGEVSALFPEQPLPDPPATPVINPPGGGGGGGGLGGGGGGGGGGCPPQFEVAIFIDGAFAYTVCLV